MSLDWMDHILCSGVTDLDEWTDEEWRRLCGRCPVITSCEDFQQGKPASLIVVRPMGIRTGALVFHTDRGKR